ncbi:MAG: hypothetical protein ACP5IJ_00845 [Candidatus Nanoarchaeia archaeon]
MNNNSGETSFTGAPKFESKLAVFKIKTNFMAPFKKCRYLYIEPKTLKSKVTFLKYLNNFIRNWPNGTYYLKLSTNQVFARFDVTNGKISRFYEKSPITGKVYPIWNYWM